jgi:FkbM family methyltransferase
MKQALRKYLPHTLFKVLSYSNVYRKRIYNWYQVIRRVRGKSFQDKVKLSLSAFAGLFLSAKNLAEWRHPILLWDAWVVVKEIGQFEVRAYTDDLNHVNPEREKNVLDMMKNLLKKGDTFVDAGANIGFFSVIASQLVGKSGKVHAIEMLPQNQNILLRHIEMNALDNVFLHKTALFNESNKKLKVHMPKHRFGMASIINSEGESPVQQYVLTSRLDQLLSKQQISVMKIDTEGAEKYVLLGAVGILENVDTIIFEMYIDDPNRKFVFNFLKENNFELSKIDNKDYLAIKRSII